MNCDELMALCPSKLSKLFGACRSSAVFQRISICMYVHICIIVSAEIYYEAYSFKAFDGSLII